jgi:hypothetical protein
MTGSRAAISTAIGTPPIIELAPKYRLSAIYPWPEPATEKGSLIAFGADQAALHGQVAGYAAKILRGSSQPTFRSRRQAVKYFWATLIGTGSLAPEGETHPRCEWRTTSERVYRNEANNFAASVNEAFTARLGKGIQLRPGCTEIWDGSRLTEERPTGGP